jgi:hypothetical protein
MGALLATSAQAITFNPASGDLGSLPVAPNSTSVFGTSDAAGGGTETGGTGVFEFDLGNLDPARTYTVSVQVFFTEENLPSQTADQSWSDFQVAWNDAGNFTTPFVSRTFTNSDGEVDPPETSGTILSFVLQEGTFNQSDSIFLLASVTGDTTNTGATLNLTNITADVPVPAALPLMATGLGLLGFMGWRRRRAEA